VEAWVQPHTTLILLALSSWSHPESSILFQKGSVYFLLSSFLGLLPAQENFGGPAATLQCFAKVNPKSLWASGDSHWGSLN
jgi:hypothetical protein